MRTWNRQECLVRSALAILIRVARLSLGSVVLAMTKQTGKANGHEAGRGGQYNASLLKRSAEA